MPRYARHEAAAWYVETFGAKVGEGGVSIPVWRGGWHWNECGHPDAPRPSKGYTLDHIGFEVTDLEAFCKKLLTMGIVFDYNYSKTRDKSFASADSPTQGRGHRADRRSEQVLKIREAHVKQLLSILSIAAFGPLATSWAQLAAPNQAGVRMGHVHVVARDLEGEKKVWTTLGGTAIKIDATDVVKFPGVFIFISRGVPAIRRSASGALRITGEFGPEREELRPPQPLQHAPGLWYRRCQ
jgi:hypothetical protein